MSSDNILIGTMFATQIIKKRTAADSGAGQAVADTVVIIFVTMSSHQEVEVPENTHRDTRPDRPHR